MVVVVGSHDSALRWHLDWFNHFSWLTRVSSRQTQAHKSQNLESPSPFPHFLPLFFPAPLLASHFSFFSSPSPVLLSLFFPNSFFLPL